MGITLFVSVLVRVFLKNRTNRIDKEGRDRDSNTAMERESGGRERERKRNKVKMELQRV